MQTWLKTKLQKTWLVLRPWKRVKLFSHYLGHSMLRFWNDRCFSAAAGLSYSLLLALVPLLAIGFAILAAFPVFQDIVDSLKNYVTSEFVPKSINVRQWIDGFLANTQSVTALGIVGLVVTTIIVLDSIETKFNQIFRQKEIRPFGQRLMMFWAIVTLTPVLVGGSVALSEFVFAKTALQQDQSVRKVFGLGQDVAPYLLLVAAFTLAYMIVPYRRVPFLHALWGGLVAAAMFTLLRWGFTVYFENFPAYKTIYGALSLLPLFLIWMYLVWCAVLLGAEMVASLPEWFARRRMFGGSKPTRRLLTALSVLYQLYLGQKRGEPVREIDLSRQIAIEPSEVRPLLDELRDANLITAGEDDDWVLARDPRRISLFDMYLALQLHLAPDFDDQSSGMHWISRFRELLRDEEDAAQGVLGMTLDELFAPEETPALMAKNEAAE